MNKRRVVTAAFISALLISAVAGTQFVNTAMAKTITVPDDYLTIQDAINAASEGDTIFVRQGNYEFPINQTLLINKTISLVAENAENTRVILHPPLIQTWLFSQPYWTYPSPITIQANYVKLANFTFVSDGGVVSVAGDAIRIVGNAFNTGFAAIGNGTQINGNKMTFLKLEGCPNQYLQGTI